MKQFMASDVQLTAKKVEVNGQVAATGGASETRRLKEESQGIIEVHRGDRHT